MMVIIENLFFEFITITPLRFMICKHAFSSINMNIYIFVSVEKKVFSMALPTHYVLIKMYCIMIASSVYYVELRFPSIPLIVCLIIKKCLASMLRPTPRVRNITDHILTRVKSTVPIYKKVKIIKRKLNKVNKVSNTIFLHL